MLDTDRMLKDPSTISFRGAAAPYRPARGAGDEEFRCSAGLRFAGPRFARGRTKTEVCATRFRSEIPPLRSAQGRNDPSANGFASAFQPARDGKSYDQQANGRGWTNSECTIHHSQFRIALARS